MKVVENTTKIGETFKKSFFLIEEQLDVFLFEFWNLSYFCTSFFPTFFELTPVLAQKHTRIHVKH